MEIKIDGNAGFCFGVVKAIASAEANLQKQDSLYCLGDIVHNNAEVNRLKTQGLQVIDYDQLQKLHDTTVLIRAHGEPPTTYRMAQERNIRLIDATCPIVLALQKKVREGYDTMQKVNGQVVIFGKQGHAEVIGLNGQTDNTAIIISNPGNIEKIDFARPIRLYSQTTKSRDEYQQLIENIREHKSEDFVAYDTICNRVANRATQLEEFARSVDVVVFVSGSNSSNGHYLYEYCRKVQPRTYMISDVENLQPEWFHDVQRVGVTGATSTPRWLMEECAKKINAL
jgi:4-hydroxy-3-methylbut-2-enyl diphosphate reductase